MSLQLSSVKHVTPGVYGPCNPFFLYVLQAGAGATGFMRCVRSHWITHVWKVKPPFSLIHVTQGREGFTRCVRGYTLAQFWWVQPGCMQPTGREGFTRCVRGYTSAQFWYAQPPLVWYMHPSGREGFTGFTRCVRGYTSAQFWWVQPGCMQPTGREGFTRYVRAHSLVCYRNVKPEFAWFMQPVKPRVAPGV